MPPAANAADVADWKAAIRDQLAARDGSPQMRMLCQIVGAHSRLAVKYEHVCESKTLLDAQVIQLKQERRALEKRVEAAGGSGSSSSASHASSEEVERLQSENAKLKAELYEVQRSRNDEIGKELEMYKSVKRLEEGLAAKTSALEKAEQELVELRAKNIELKQKIEQISMKLETINDEHIALSLEYSQAEIQLRQVKAENKELVERWLEYKQNEAERMNEVNEAIRRVQDDKVRVELMEASLPLKDLSDLPDAAAFPRSPSTRSPVPSISKYTFQGHMGEVFDCKFDNAGNFATCGSDRVVKIWQNSGAPLMSLPKMHSKAVTCLDFSGSGENLVSGGSDAALHIWSVRTGRSVYTMRSHTETVHSVCFSRDGNEVYSASKDHTIKAWDATKGVIRFTCPCSTCYDMVTGVHGGLFSAHFDKCIRVWDLRGDNRKATSEVHTEHTQQITSMAFSQDRNTLLTAAKDNTIAEWDARMLGAGEGPIHTYRHDDYRVGTLGCRVSYSPDGSYIAAGSKDGVLFIWNTAKTKLEKQLREGCNKGVVTACAWHGSQVVTCSAKDIVIWGS